VEFIKVREEKYKRKYGEAQVESGGKECVILFSRCF
jgi:hypothetical protein